MRSIFIIFLIIFSLIADNVNGQRISEFTHDRDTFLTELESLFGNVRQEQTLNALNQFTELTRQGAFTDDQEALIMQTADAMLKNRLRPDPHFGEYFTALIKFTEEALDQSLFTQWHDVLSKILPGSRQDFIDFNNTFSKIISENKLHDSRAVNWITDTDEIAIVMVNDKPGFRLQSMTLTGERGARGDTIIITNASGIYYPLDNTWHGNSGKVSWTRVGFDENEVYAELGNYKIDLRLSEFVADSVRFYHAALQLNGVKGNFKENAMGQSRGERSSYPEFSSYDHFFELDDLAKDMHYKGGFTMRGKRIIGSGTDVKPAVITMFYEGIPKVKARSQNFIMNEDNIISENTMITIFLDEDSIFHPQSNFNYLVNDNHLSISTRSEGISASPFINTYHNLEMYFEGLRWDVGSPRIEVSLITDPNATVSFQSMTFYREQDYARIQGIQEYHPADLLFHLSRDLDTTHFHISDLAYYKDMQTEHVKPLVYNMAREGFIIYNPTTERFFLLDKVLTYFRAYRGVQDHDLIRFQSSARQNRNATISLLNNDLDIFGVERINMSDSNNIVIFPKNGNVTFKKNRDMKFDGHIMAGRFDFYGDMFEFDYSNFQTRLNNVDSVKFVFPEIDPKTGRRHMRGIQNVIQDVSGTLYFDNRNNKSGLRQHPQYPIFESEDEAFVYYDQKSIFNGVYERENFYFNIEPFTIDSLNDFTREGLAFEGSFVSAGIFPEIDYELTIQEDYSLGFQKQTPAGGYDMYGGKGNGKMTMKLSNSGFFGSGSIEFLGSVSHSDQFYLFPDSTNALSRKFEIPDDHTLDYPATVGHDVYTHWRPYQDTMFVEQTEDPFRLYQQGAEFSGKIALNPQNLGGDGTYTYRNAKIRSTMFAFERTKFDADTARLNIVSDDPEVFAFHSPNVAVDFDMEAEIVESRANDDTTTFDFPLNRYITSIREFVWDLDADLITFDAPADQADKDAWFLSKHPEQDSLWFNASHATYDLSSYLLKPGKIPMIASADAHIFPDNETVTIEKNANMQTLKNARIKTDTLENYHEFYDATVNILGRKNYAGYGDYDYVDRRNNIEKLHFSRISVDRRTQRTIASGNIEKDTTAFHLGPQFRFYGNHELKAERKHIRFNGYVLPNHGKGGYRTTWFKYNEIINPDSLYFNVANATGEDQRPLYYGMFITAEANPEVYTMLMGQRERHTDAFVFAPDSVLYFDDNKNAYVLGSYPSVFENRNAGNIMHINPFAGEIHAEGLFDLYNSEGKLEFITAGKGSFSPRDSIYRFNVMTSLDFPFDEDILLNMSDTINDIGFRLPETNLFSDAVTIGVPRILGTYDTSSELLSEVLEYRVIPPKDRLRKSILFAETEYVWNPELRSFHTTGPLGLANVLDDRVNKSLQNSGIQISRARRQEISIYMEVTSGSWFFYNFDNSGLQVMASNPDFNDMFRETRDDYAESGYTLRPASRRQIDVLQRNLGLR